MFFQWSSTKHTFFCCNFLIWLVTKATKKQNLQKNIKKSTPQKLFGGYRWNFAELFLTIASTKILFFIILRQKNWRGIMLFPQNCLSGCLSVPLSALHFRTLTWIVIRAATIHSPHDTIRITILVSRYDTYRHDTIRIAIHFSDLR